MFIKIDKTNIKKTIVNGCPRIKDYKINKKYNKKINTILFLSFDSRRGIPSYKENKNLNWWFSYKKVIEILNELSSKKDLEIIIKKKVIHLETLIIS